MIARTEATTDITPLMPQAHGTPLGYIADRRDRPTGIAVPRHRPSGASSAIVAATRSANGRSSNPSSSGSSRNAPDAIRTQAAPSAATSSRRGFAARPDRYAPAPVNRSSENNTTDSAYVG